MASTGQLAGPYVLFQVTEAMLSIFSVLFTALLNLKIDVVIVFVVSCRSAANDCREFFHSHVVDFEIQDQLITYAQACLGFYLYSVGGELQAVSPDRMSEHS